MPKTLAALTPAEREEWIGKPVFTHFDFPSILHDVDGANAELLIFMDGEWRTGIWMRIHAVELPGMSEA
ncbi:hypothetical protein H0194_04695 [Corynebacterium incognita]|uniref:Uncharacterized protein n=1 Tax=Corynebacterium incognita TaxID=2754725 RepID=A0A7G7CRR3_9CORY|nr:hypothetical protein [Corynebacterium incognita]QNE90279.1 hypothetical protein H0194_04695 [Corynebacterium incognita]